MPNTNSPYHINFEKMDELTLGIVQASMSLGEIVPAKPHYEAAAKKATQLRDKAERYRRWHRQMPLDTVLMDETVLRLVVDAAFGIRGEDAS